MGPGYWLLRQMILSLEYLRGRQNSAYSPSKINNGESEERNAGGRGRWIAQILSPLHCSITACYLWVCATAAGLALPFRSTAVMAITSGCSLVQTRAVWAEGN